MKHSRQRSARVSRKPGEPSAGWPRSEDGNAQAVRGNANIIRGKVDSVGDVSQVAGGNKSRSAPHERVEDAGTGRKNRHQVAHERNRLACEVHLVGRLEIMPENASRKHARAVLFLADAAARGNEDKLRLVAEHALVWAASLRLVPGNDGAPCPPRHLQGVRGQGQLPPVGKDH